MPTKKKLPQGRPPIHPWEKWLNPDRKSVKRIQRGRDFNCTVKTMDVTMRRQAQLRQLWVSLSVDQENEIITIKSVKRR